MAVVSLEVQDIVEIGFGFFSQRRQVPANHDDHARDKTA